MTTPLTSPGTGESVKVTVSMSATLPARALPYLNGADSYRSFIQDVEGLVCAKINSIVFNQGPVGKMRPSLEPADLACKRQSQCYAVARHMCAFIFYNHPHSKGMFSSPRLAALYNRDHTTILSGLERMHGFIERRHAYARALQEVCNALNGLGYPAFNLWEKR